MSKAPAVMLPAPPLRGLFEIPALVSASFGPGSVAAVADPLEAVAVRQHGAVDAALQAGALVGLLRPPR